MSWTKSLIDIQIFSSSRVDLYIRDAYSELGELVLYHFLDLKFSKLNKDERRADSLAVVNSYFNFDREIKKGRFCSSSTSPFIWEIENFYTVKLL